MLCTRCGKDFPESQITHKKQGDLCETCLKRVYFRCDFCHKEKLKSVASQVITADGVKLICRTCTDMRLYKDIFICGICEKKHTIDQTIVLGNGGHVCKKCGDENMKKCAKCGKSIFSEAALYSTDLDAYFCCKEHIPDTHTICVVCKKVVKKSTTITALSPYGSKVVMCKSCSKGKVFTCTECKGVFLNPPSYKSKDGTMLCIECANKNKVECESCGHTLLKAEVVSVEMDDNRKVLVCKECRSKIVTRDYNYKPKPIFLKTKEDDDTATYFGIELEVTSKELDFGEVAQRFRSTFKSKIDKILYLKRDSSIGNGFEIVTHPMTYNYLRKELLLQPILTWLAQYVYEDGNGICAIHVHIDKNQIKAKEDDSEALNLRNREFLQKLLIFFYSNFEKIIKFSERKNREWVDRYCHPYNKETISRILRGNGTDDRHGCINVNNRNTIEIRVFNGSILPETFMKFMRFTHCLLEFLKEYPKNLFIKEFRGIKQGDQRLTKIETWEAFLDYVKGKNQKLYTELINIDK